MEQVRTQDQPGAGRVTAIPLAVLQRTDGRIAEDLAREEEASDDLDEREGRLVCIICGNPITTDADCVSVNGSHEHACRNPGGMVFRVGCFSNAGGCFIMGSPTEEYTWFPGYAWCYVICSMCHTHLGWWYQSRGGGFFGLILDQLTRR